ncbi:hypothetical protein GJ688_11605 [Heliobacillus mobilis]|uniref:Uncharacterized protein n=1 Tax=Heliobacterium mobile TaxID=28064 RepID=A0A6I3SL05_HELMO|nr:hypothetical protein [Heliobacterium mobile]MTV49621.1 hypothetical protein [Heliobacterium mobile]
MKNNASDQETLIIREVGPDGTHTRKLTNTVDMGAGDTSEGQAKNEG